MGRGACHGPRGNRARRAVSCALDAGSVAALIGLLLVLWLARLTPIIDRLDAVAFDEQVRLVRWWRGAPAALEPAQDVVLVGIDDQSLDALGLPLAMIHASLGRALEAIALAGPRVIGVDLSLPQQSFDPLVPGLDRELLRGLLAARRGGGLVLALDADAQGRLRIPALSMLAAAGGSEAFGLPLFPIDCDGVVRRFEPNPGGSTAQPSCAASTASPDRATGADLPGDGAPVLVPTFVARIAAHLGRGRLLREPGWIDYTHGAAFSYLPLRDVVAWSRSGDVPQLRAHFADRVVLLGSVLPYLDRLRLPATLAGWEPATAGVPGLIVNAQVLRNVLGAGLIRPLGALPAMLVMITMAALALVDRTGLRWGLWLLALLLLLGGGAVAHAAGWFCAPSQGLLVGASAAVLRNVADLHGERRERRRLTALLGGYLSPQVVRAILHERAGAAGTRRAAALLFADLHGFTAWSEAADPALVLETLNRYYGLVTPVLHAHGGTIDNFRGDGIMVMFGVPEASAQPCAAAFAAACQVSALVDQFSEQQAARGLTPVTVTIGLAYGEVVFGDLGSADRKDYTALGDAVNVAARLQDLAKQLGAPVLMTQAFAQQLPAGQVGLCDLGTHPVKGHSPVAVCAWQPQQDGGARI